MDRHLGLNTLASPQFVKHKKPLGWDVKRFYKPKDVLLPSLVHFQWLTDHLKTLTSEHSQQDANHWYAWKTEELDGVGKNTQRNQHRPGKSSTPVRMIESEKFRGKKWQQLMTTTKKSSIKRCMFAIAWACMGSSGTATLALFTADASKR